MIFFSILGELMKHMIYLYFEYLLCLILVHFLSLLTLVHFLLLCRKIWSSFCLYPTSHYCCPVLLVLCLCWYVWFFKKYSYMYLYFDLIYYGPCKKHHVMFHFCWSFVGAGGLSFLQFCNLNSFRTKFILGFSIFVGLSVPQYFNEYTAINGYGPVHTGARWVWIRCI